MDREPGDAGLSAVLSLGRYLSLGKSFNLLDSFLTYVSFSLSLIFLYQHFWPYVIIFLMTSISLYKFAKHYLPFMDIEAILSSCS